MSTAVAEFVSRWKGNAAGESKVAQQHFLELCQALGVPGPSPKEAEELTYSFERTITFSQGRGRISTEFVDVYRKDHFVWENKQGSVEGAGRVGHGRRGTAAWRKNLNKAFAQAKRYALHVEDLAPPFLVVCDVGHEIRIWSDFSRTGKQYDQRPAKVLTYDDLLTEKGRDYLTKVLREPKALNPSRYQAEVTRLVAEDLAKVARSLEAEGGDGHLPAEVSRFLMRCVFTMFAEDTEMLPKNSFTNLLDKFQDNPSGLVKQLELLWKLMDEGGYAIGIGDVLRFNGGLFHEQSALLLTPKQIKLLHKAARHDWSEVEPTIFGTLVERALDPVERHSLGAHFTPRPYIERLVRPAVMAPLRDDWLGVQAAVLEALGDGEPTTKARNKAVGLLREFHGKLCRVKVLDPACGTGNFLYVTYDLLKDLEDEVLQQLADLGELQTGLALAGQTVTPTQMLGIEKNPRAREIADIVLWIGHLQRLRRNRAGEGVPEPVLSESDHIECRDAVLAWDGDPVPRRDEDGNVVKVWDMRTMKTDPVTGRDVPDETAMVPVYDHPNARPAEWPEADFVVSNPPFVGNKRMRMALGDGYTETLRQAWPEMSGGVDFVMYWWERAARLVLQNRLRQFGLITTNSITQSSNRRVLQPHLGAGLRLLYAVPDHPWVAAGADVRIAMTVAGLSSQPAIHAVTVDSDSQSSSGERILLRESAVPRIHSNLCVGADVSELVPLEANARLSYMGVILVGMGFALSQSEVATVDPEWEQHPSVVRPYQNAREFLRGEGNRVVIDFFGMDEDEARRQHPRLYSHVLETVRPLREKNKRAVYRRLWWVHGEPRPALREAQAGLSRFIVTPGTSKHVVFGFVASDLLPDQQLLSICSDEAWVLGVLSSRIHRVFAIATGSRMGVGNDFRWRPTRCFDPFPFPDWGAEKSKDALKSRVGLLAERLDAHRKRVQAQGKIAGKLAHTTNQYNALERAVGARSGGAPLSPKERAFHDGAMIAILGDIHRELDDAVAAAYGWSPDLSDEEILDHLVSLNGERAKEEAAGNVRYVRPDFQDPGIGEAPIAAQTPLGVVASRPAQTPAQATQKPWPKDSTVRLIALRDTLRAANAPLTAADIASRFKRARKTSVEKALDGLVALGAIVHVEGEGYAVPG